MRAVHGTFQEYHTSADNLDFVHAESLQDSVAKILQVIAVIEGNAVFVNNKPKGEPQLGKRGLYEGLSGSNDQRKRELALLWVLNLSDGKHSLLDIAERAKLPFSAIKEAAKALAATDLLSRQTQQP
jgi:aminopeptidase-like protein